MKYYKLLTVLLVALVLPALAAPLPLSMPGDTFKMQQGWYNGQVAWYIQTDTGNIRWAMQQLSDSGAAARERGREKFHPCGLFTIRPQPRGRSSWRAGNAAYAALVDIKMIAWNPGFSQAQIISASQIASLSLSGRDKSHRHIRNRG